LNYRNKIAYVLVRKLGFSFKEVNKAIKEGRVAVNQQIVFDNVLLNAYDTLSFDHTILQSPDQFQYYAYHKPRGVECSLSAQIPDSLFYQAPAELKGLIYAGRLDKDSEGLLILMNDGHLYNQIIQPKYKVDKQYEVHLEKPHDDAFLKQLSEGVTIKGGTTLPCKVWAITPNSFGIVLNQGLNRQIRRMCFALGNYVTQLTRLSIGNVQLGELPAGAYRKLDKEEISHLRNL
jgi:23S rRNA pseudouridine2604 synthase